ncbi:hypothetical protein [Chitinolyticbacter albus]|uniref:hypothetical protein n=1 Tax=Chitinolyticbacter albus TaxID=2961951 RepID=UPI00210C7AB0|nr:hypothetical protein [Chitinolyticbacter albus]
MSDYEQREYTPEDFLREKNIFDIFKLSWRVRLGKFNLAVPILVFAYAMASWLIWGQASSSEYVRQLATNAIGWVMGMLGFMIAGYTVFATLTRSELSLSMMGFYDESRRVTLLQVTHINFIKVFIWSVVFCFGYLLVLLMGAPSGVLTQVVARCYTFPGLKGGLLSFSEASIYASLAYVLLLMKSFVFNVYHSIMTSLAWEAKNRG